MEGDLALACCTTACRFLVQAEARDQRTAQRCKKASCAWPNTSSPFARPPSTWGCSMKMGRTVAHVAAIRDDVGLIDLLTGQNRDHPSDKKGALTDINARCLESGWTPLHYAAAGGMVGACKALIKAGALLNIHAYIPGMVKDSADGKGPTPLELVKLHLARPSNPAPLTAALTAVEAELSEAVRRLDEIRSQREAERSNKEAKAKAEKQRLAAKEQTERELLERKQKQLKERQDRERQREEDDARKWLLLR